MKNHDSSAGNVVLVAKPAYTAAYTIHPAAISGRRPKRSDAEPPTSAAVIFTTCSNDQNSGMSCGPPAASVSRSNKNASAELPKVKTERTNKYLTSGSG